ncbi:DNA mismatch repair endonuclease MutL [Gloeobacter kilaueensis]|uniref:DNA mismatch repair endonuclease MutL n=1 Tax=Gloeobacter kilaueensis TaxID=1416614 RepID=UPI000429E8E3|nr:DNA mismatch repair endonuclease MutL [Gloeobacter kilaueensis]
MAAIAPLPEATVRLLAAGEVIDSPAAVVRELVENSLDAGADRIRVGLWPELWRVQIQDNGFGIEASELAMAAHAHATSKLRTLSDLWQLRTLGFRGEGLHSIAVVAQLEIVSATGASPTALRARYDHTGALQSLEAVAGAPGTVVTASELFDEQPVRRRFLADHKAQARLVAQLLQRYALAHPGHLFELAHDGRKVLQLPPAANLKQRILQILTQYDEHDLREVTLAHQSRSVRLVMGLPDRCSRARADWLQIYVNRRFVRHSELEQAVRTGFERTLRRGRHPLCIVQLELPAEEVDWNRHPAKLEVQLAATPQVAALVIAAIAEGLRHFAPKPSEGLLSAAEDWLPYRTGDQESGLLLRALIQMQRTYIVAEYPGGICLVEQHVAHERVLFEQLETSWELVAVDPPIAIDLSERQAANLREQGLAIEPFGARNWLVRSIPAALVERSDCLEALVELSRQEDSHEMRAALSCRTAIRNGTVLTPAQMQELLERWQRTKNPHTCPHGRPIYMPLTDGELARFFRRRWHICGS